MVVMNWISGKAGHGYFKAVVIKHHSFGLEFMKCLPGSVIELHRDSDAVYDIWKLHFFLWNPSEGGHFLGRPVFGNRFMQLIKVDTSEHGMSKVERGIKLILTFTFARKKYANS